MQIPLDLAIDQFDPGAIDIVERGQPRPCAFQNGFCFLVPARRPQQQGEVGVSAAEERVRRDGAVEGSGPDARIGGGQGLAQARIATGFWVLNGRTRSPVWRASESEMAAAASSAPVASRVRSARFEPSAGRREPKLAVATVKVALHYLGGIRREG